MGLLSNDILLTEIQKYLENTDFTNKEIGHRLALTFIPAHLEPQVEDLRYSFTLKHKLIKERRFDQVTYGGFIVEMVLELNRQISDSINMVHRKIYDEVGLIEDNRCTKELISTVIANSIALSPTLYKGNTVTSLKKADNLQNIFPEFNEQAVQYFLNQVDNYTQTI